MKQSRQEKLVNLLSMEKKMYDKDISKRLGLNLHLVQYSIHIINSNKKKYKDFSIIKTGTRNCLRELITPDSSENNIFNSRDKDLKSGLKKFDIARKKGIMGMNTRDGQKSRIRLMEGLLKQNLNASIEAQKLLQ